ncbi:MAG TPA: peptidoglycan bridge formation glycyltransferase FemA/FemB family protein [Candidatus Saccharimonadales bacterium]|nr:peptidoglycan bridge formation glycyltransferase FemA/FemB family protein [Candidatus Saccharimonadales bacterium]
MQHFLQSPAWGRFQQSLRREVITDGGEGWHYLAILETGRFNTRLYCPYGPYAESEKAFESALASLKAQAAKHHVTFLRIEPTGAITADYLRKNGFKHVTYNQLQPEHTQIIDLHPDEDQIIAAMDQNNRNLYRNYQKKGLLIRTSQNPNDISILTTLLHGVAKRNGIHTHSDSYFQAQAKALFPAGEAKLFYVTYEDKPIAASVVFDDAATRYYVHAGSDDAYRKLSAGTALLAYMIIDAKRNGQTNFDLYGIAPNDDPAHPWAGFTKFKKSFGGTPLAYIGAWDLPLIKPQYLLYRLYQQLTRKR